MKNIKYVILTSLFLLFHTLGIAYDLPFQTDDYRYQNMSIFPRTLSSLGAVVPNTLHWDTEDFATFFVVTAATGSMMIHTGPSIDVRFQEKIKANHNKTLDLLFPSIYSEIMAAGVIGVASLTFATGYMSHNAEYYEYASLMLEAAAVYQIHHLAFKLSIGREGPAQGDGQGVIFGPRRSLELFPSGTPSGHVGTTAAMLAVTYKFWDKEWLKWASYLAIAYYTFSLVYNQQHFISDMVWGAPMGWAVGEWIVRHRSSKYTYKEGGPVRKKSFASRMNVVPMFNGDLGFSFVVGF